MGKATAPTAPPLEQLPVGELARKLAESQQMIARFSRENERLADQNEQLTGSKQVVANDYKGGILSLNVWSRCGCYGLDCLLCWKTRLSLCRPGSS